MFQHQLLKVNFVWTVMLLCMCAGSSICKTSKEGVFSTYVSNIYCYCCTQLNFSYLLFTGNCTKTTERLICLTSTLIVTLIIASMISAGIFGHFVRPTEQRESYYIEQGDMIDLGTYDSNRYSKVEVSSTLNDSMITVFSCNVECHSILVYPNKIYHIEGSLNFTSLAINRTGISSASGYFAHSSRPTFQLNATGPESLDKSSCCCFFHL